MSDLQIDVYKTINARRSLDWDDPAVVEAVKALTEMHLVADNPLDPTKPVALPPEHAERRLMQLERQRVQQAAARMQATVRIREALSPVFESARRNIGGGIEPLVGLPVIRERLRVLTEQTTTEVLTAQPSVRPPEVLEMSMKVDGAFLDRGVAMRTIYPAAARSRPHECHWASVMSKRGARIRTLAEEYNRVIILDGLEPGRAHAFLDDRAHEDPHAALHVTNPAMVAHLHAEFMLAWERADTWNGERGPVEVGDLTKGKLRILQCLGNGMQDQQIAKALQISTRTMTKQMNELYDLLGVESRSRFELGLRWAELKQHLDQQVSA
ncbi:helix-turn-helix transcriptional regulator [Streptomyces yangpuensis]